MIHPFEPISGLRDDGAQAPALEPARLDALVGLLGRLRFNALLILLIDDCRERPGRIRACHARGDFDGVSAEAARLSRAAASIGAMRLGDAAWCLVDLRDPAPAVPLIDALDEAARATLCVARHLLGERFAVSASA